MPDPRDSKGHVLVTRTPDRWTIVCTGTVDEFCAIEIERAARVCLAESPAAIRLDLTGVDDITDEGVTSVGRVVSLCKSRGVRARMFLSLETPVQLIVDLDDEIRDHTGSDDVGLGGEGAGSVRFEHGGIVVSV